MNWQPLIGASPGHGRRVWCPGWPVGGDYRVFNGWKAMQPTEDELAAPLLGITWSHAKSGIVLDKALRDIIHK